MTSGVLGDGGDFDAEPGALVVTLTWRLRASSSTNSAMQAEIVLGKGA